MGDPVPGQSGVKHTALIALLVCAAYFVGAELAFMLRIPSTRSSIIWVPNAVLLAVLLLTRPRTWAIWLLAALPAHLVAQSRDAGFVLVLLYPFFANVAQVIVAAMGLRWFAAAPPRFNTLRDMTLFVLIAVITAPALVSFLAAWLFVSVGWETDVWLVSRGRFLNNMTTGLTVAPLILMAAESGLAGLRRRRVQRYGEFALLAGGLVGALYAIHMWTTPGAKSIPVQLYAPLPFLLWAAVRFGPGGLCLLLLVVAAHSISETIGGRGPYVAQTPAENVLALQISLAVLATPMMFVAALIGERRKKGEALQQSEERYRAVVEHQTELVCRFLPDATLTFVNLAYARYFGKSPDELIGQSFLSAIPEEERQAAMEHIQWLGKNPSPGSSERRVFTAQGELRWLQSVDRPIFADDGCVVEFQSVGRDITERKRAESRLKTQYAITRILSESASVDEATPRIVQSICECLDWKVGEIWRADGETKLSTFVKAWHLPSRDFAEFASASVRFTFPPGVGLPGRVCESRKPVWIRNLADDSSFRRVSLATKAGLRSGFGFPILLGEKTLGAMVFFSREVREPDHDVLQMIASIASQIGQFIERKRAEEGARAATGRFEGILGIAQDAIISVDSNQRIILFNQGAEKVFGYMQAEVLGRPLDRLLPPPFVDVHRKHIEEFARSPDVARTMGQRREVSGRRKDGGEFPAEASISKLDVGGELVFTVILRDVTERKRAEEALRESLRESEERRRAAEALARVGRGLTETLDVGLVAQRIADSLRELFAADVAVYRQESSGELVAIGTSEKPAAERAFVHPALPAGHGVSGLAIRERRPVVTTDFLEDPRVTHAPEMRASLEINPARAVLAVPLIVQDRVLGTVSVRRVQPFDAQAVALAQVFADQAVAALENARLYQEVRDAYEELARAQQQLLHDITERRRVEHLISQVFECSPDAVSIVGRDYRYQRVNPGYERIGRPAEGMVGMHVADVVGMEVFERTVKPNLDRCFAGEEVSYAEWFATALGRRYLAVSYSPLRPDSERVDAGLVIIRDLTEPMLASEALRVVQAELAHVTRVATLGELTASIAHEINQPLAAVVNNASACVRWLAAQNMEEARQSAARVIADGHRAAEIIGRIRNLAKKVPPQKDWLDINETIREVLALARSEVQGHRVSLQTDLTDDMPLILGDRIQLQQVLLNLIMNAIEAMSGVGEGPRELWVSSEKVASAEVLIAVLDSGPGLDPQSLDQLFDAFFTTKPDGLGMGLAISRSIVESHGGRLWATANAPHGAVFQFTLPMGSERVP